MVHWWVLVNHGQAMPIMLAKAWDKRVMTRRVAPSFSKKPIDAIDTTPAAKTPSAA
jgi:hypothetical protein